MRKIKVLLVFLAVTRGANFAQAFQAHSAVVSLHASDSQLVVILDILHFTVHNLSQWKCGVIVREKITVLRVGYVS